MPIYAYKCRTCGATADSTHRGDDLGPCIDPDCTGWLRRKFQVQMAPVMQEHFNPTTNTVVSSMQGFKDDLKRKGDAYTAKTGIEVNYQPLDPAEARKTMTSEGLDATNARLRREGKREHKIPGVI